MPIKHLLKKATLAALLVSTTLLAQTPYDEGQKALREQDWMAAAEQFEQVIKDDSGQVDAAMYWRAYAFYKAGRGKEAERELRRLERKYPESGWLKEAQALRIEHQDPEKSIEQVAANGSVMDDELRLFALAQLMDRSPERALPLVMDLAHNSDSPKVRQDAVFVLAISEAPQARQAVVEMARDSNDPEMQIHAIHILGSMEATEELQALYATLQDRDTKVAVIEALSIAGESALLKQVLANETDPELRKAAIYGIAMEGDGESAELLESMYESAGSLEEKSAILEALTIMDYAPSLFKILQLEQDEEMRSAAIQALAINGGEEATDYLLKLYPKGSRAEKTAVIESMMIMENTEGLLGLLKQENDPELKREMLQLLTIMDSEKSDEYLFELLEKNG